MARKVEDFVVASEGRDKGKHFRITEMAAITAERWAFRALLALTHAGVEIPEEAKAAGMQAMAHAGIKALEKLDYHEVAPLLDEMMACVKVLPDPSNQNIVRPLMMNGFDGDDIEEIATILELRQRVFMLHASFFFKGK